MTKQEFIEEVLDHFTWDRYFVIKRKHGSVPQITYGEFLEAVFEAEDIPGIATYFNISVRTVNRILSNSFPKITPSGKYCWKDILLDILNYKQCNRCKDIKSKERFALSNKATSKVASICKACDKKKYIKDRTPKWVNILHIADFYDSCPKGYHIDHIIPLRGDIVSGLHVLNNLQYLPAKDNIAKGNKFSS